jgi:surface antigen
VPRRPSLALAAAGLSLAAAACAGGPASPPAAAPPPTDPYARLSPEDVALAAAALAKALEANRDGERARWRNEATGNAGSITPLRTYVTANGYFCRPYQEELRTDAGAERFRHEACRNEDGVWVWL